MFRHGQCCPISRALEVLGERWTLLVLRELMLGSTQFNPLQRGLRRVSPTTPSKRLAELQQAGLVVRKRIARPEGHAFHLTPAARELQPVLLGLGESGMRWARGQVADAELDVGLPMADIERRIDRRGLPAGRTVLHFRFTDLDRDAQRWLKIDGDEGELCLDDPGDDVDVHYASTLRTMTEVWMGDVSLHEAQRSGSLHVVAGPAYPRTRARGRRASCRA